MAYCGVPMEARRANHKRGVKSKRYLVTIGVVDASRFDKQAVGLPVNNVGYKGIPYGGKASPQIEYRDWREVVVAVARHEMRHIEQFRFRKPVSEVDCEMAAAAALRRYRELQAQAS